MCVTAAYCSIANSRECLCDFPLRTFGNNFIKLQFNNIRGKLKSFFVSRRTVFILYQSSILKFARFNFKFGIMNLYIYQLYSILKTNLFTNNLIIEINEISTRTKIRQTRRRRKTIENFSYKRKRREHGGMKRIRQGQKRGEDIFFLLTKCDRRRGNLVVQSVAPAALNVRTNTLRPFRHWQRRD